MKKRRGNKFLSFIQHYYNNITLICIFLISRIVFLNTSPIFFDSPEYIGRFTKITFLDGLLAGHWPYHFGYVALFWPVYQLFQRFTSHGLLFILILQSVFAAIALFWFYKIILSFSSKPIALFSSVIAALLPLFWITNVTFMEETAYIFFFFGSLNFFMKSLREKINVLPFILAVVFFSLAFFTNSTVVLWAPLFLLVAWEKNRKLVPLLLTSGVIAVGAALFTEGFIIARGHLMQVFPILKSVYLSKGHEFADIPLSFHGLLIFLRNIFIPLFRNNTLLITCLSFFGLRILRKQKDKFLFLFSFFWILPVVLMNQWWDSLLYGRETLIASFGFAFLVSYFLSGKKILMSVVLFYLFLVTIPSMLLLRKNIPYLEEAQLVRVLPKESLLIESHFARPQIQQIDISKKIFVNEPGESDIPKAVNFYLSQGKPVFISEEALSEPYGLYSGPFLHVLSLSYRNPFQLESVISHYLVSPYLVYDNSDDIVMYQIKSATSSGYPLVNKLYFSPRRLDFFDPFTQAWLLLERIIR